PPPHQVRTTAWSINGPLAAYGEYTYYDPPAGVLLRIRHRNRNPQHPHRKIGKYTKLADGGIRKPIIFHLPTLAREHHFHTAIGRRWPTRPPRPPAPVATLPADQLAPPGAHFAPPSRSVPGALWLRR